MTDNVALGRLRTAAAVAAVILTPSAGALLAAPAAPAAPSATDVAAWRADGRDLPDPATATAATVRSRLAALPPAEQRELALTCPGVVGALDGAPVALRYLANQRAAREHPAGTYLLFDVQGRGRVAQVFGDLTTARRIAILVPGMSNRLSNFWRGVGGRRHRSPAVQADTLHRAMPGDDDAVIAWLGYDTPQTLREAARGDLADTGADALVRFVDGLAAVRPDATVALLGHSYGSVVIGRAAVRLPRQVTDIAVFGSPGMGVDNVAELRTTARVWAGQSARDWIRRMPAGRVFGLGHGRRPADPTFGARVFPTLDVVDHDHYLAPGTDSLAALARLTGRPA